MPAPNEALVLDVVLVTIAVLASTALVAPVVVLVPTTVLALVVVPALARASELEKGPKHAVSKIARPARPITTDAVIGCFISLTPSTARMLFSCVPVA